MNAFTPGPWQSKNDIEWESIIGNIDGSDDGQMAYTTIAVVDDCESSAATRANARLIAAAPDLLEALNAVARELAIQIGVPYIECISGPVAKARTAIKKATQP